VSERAQATTKRWTAREVTRAYETNLSSRGPPSLLSVGPVELEAVGLDAITERDAASFISDEMARAASFSMRPSVSVAPVATDGQASRTKNARASSPAAGSASAEWRSR